MKRSIKALLYPSLIVLGIALLLLATINYWGAWAVERYDRQLTGREITLDKLRLNPFRASLKLYQFTVLEENHTDTFVEFDTLYVNLHLMELFQSNYIIEEVGLYAPRIHIIQNGADYNFKDLIERFSSSDTTKQDSSQTVWAVNNILLRGGTLRYTVANLDTYYQADSLEIRCPEIAHDSDSLKFYLDFALHTGGRVTGFYGVDMVNDNYAVQGDIRRLNLNPLTRYVQDFMQVKSFDGIANSNFSLWSSFDETTALHLNGYFGFTSLALRDSADKAFASITQLDAHIDTVDVKADIYRLDSLHIVQPYGYFALYPQSNYYETLLVPGLDSSSGEASTAYASYNVFAILGQYFSEIIKNYQNTNINAEHLRIYDGAFDYEDLSLNKSFTYRIDKLTLFASNLHRDEDSAKVYASARLNEKGSFSAVVDFNPQTLNDFDAGVMVRDVDFTDFSPYTQHYTAFPFKNGTLSYDGDHTVLNKQLDAKNHILIEQPAVGDKEPVETAYKIPMPLAVGVLKDLKGNIDFDIPVKGDLSDPNFKVMPVVWQTLLNLLTKAAASPYTVVVNAVEARREALEQFELERLSVWPTADARQSARALKRVFEEYPGLHATLVHQPGYRDEFEALAMFPAKQRYLGAKADSTEIAQLASGDSLFNIFLQQRTGHLPKTASPVERALAITGGRERVENQLDSLIDEREANLRALLEGEGIAKNRFTLKRATRQELRLVNGLPRVVIELAGADAAAVREGKNLEKSQN